MEVELKVLKGLCMIYPNDKLWKIRFELMDMLKLGRFKRKVDEREELLREYLRRKYGMGKTDMDVVIRFLGGKFRVNDLKKALGRD